MRAAQSEVVCVLVFGTTVERSVRSKAKSEWYRWVCTVRALRVSDCDVYVPLLAVVRELGDLEHAPAIVVVVVDVAFGLSAARFLVVERDVLLLQWMRREVRGLRGVG